MGEASKERKRKREREREREAMKKFVATGEIKKSREIKIAKHED